VPGEVVGSGEVDLRCRYRDPTSTTDCCRRLLTVKRTCSRDTSASIALGVLNDYALYKSTHSLTHSLITFAAKRRRLLSIDGTDGQINGQTLDRFRNPDPHTMRAVSVIENITLNEMK